MLVAEADLGIVVEGVRGPGLELLDYRSDRLAAVMPESHPLARAGDLRFDDVLDHDVIALESGSSMMRLPVEQAVVLERILQLRVQLRSFEAVCKLVQCGLGVGLLPLNPDRALGEALGSVVRPLPEAWAERRMLICGRQDRPGNASLARLLSQLAASAASAASAGTPSTSGPLASVRRQPQPGASRC